MSIISDFLKGITPTKRKELVKQERERQEKETQLGWEQHQKNVEKMKNSPATTEMVDWAYSVIMNSPEYMMNIEIEKKRMSLYSEKGMGTTDGPVIYEQKSFSQIGYEDIPAGYLNTWSTVLIDILSERLGPGFSISYYNPCSKGGNSRYKAGTNGYLVKNLAKIECPQLKKW